MAFKQLPLGMLFENRLNLKLNYEENCVLEFTVQISMLHTLL